MLELAIAKMTFASGSAVASCCARASSTHSSRSTSWQ
jgi:hypothetical protein